MTLERRLSPYGRIHSMKSRKTGSIVTENARKWSTVRLGKDKTPPREGVFSYLPRNGRIARQRERSSADATRIFPEAFRKGAPFKEGPPPGKSGENPPMTLERRLSPYGRIHCMKSRKTGSIVTENARRGEPSACKIVKRLREKAFSLSCRVTGVPRGDAKGSSADAMRIFPEAFRKGAPFTGGPPP
jgi:hypothetical protein